jgi:hypothetical protein
MNSSFDKNNFDLLSKILLKSIRNEGSHPNTNIKYPTIIFVDILSSAFTFELRRDAIMTHFRIITAFLLLLSNLAALPANGEETCAAIEELGTPNLDRFDYSLSMVSRSFSLFLCEDTLTRKIDNSNCPTHLFFVSFFPSIKGLL